ncbi:hypothetical protein [Clostridium algidicarnis]|uniref:hypothetical protein n=1 Tax=Clostridium algidicarnis TaxID=37659 RepID=UPI003FD7A027
MKSVNLILRNDEMKFIEDLGIPIIDEKRNYWFIRTQGGDYFEDFYIEKYVGIEWDEVSDLNFIENNDCDIIKGLVSEKYPKIEKPGYVAKQIKKFVSDVKIGDIVLIPNKNSEKIAFGEVISDVSIYEEDRDPTLDFFMLEDDNEDIPLKKRREVKWLKVVRRRSLDPYLYKIIYSHSAIVDARPYAIFIDRTLHSFYIKDNEAHLTMKVNNPCDISAIDLSGFIYESIGLVDSFNIKTEESFDKRDISTKINVQSPGIIEFVGPIGIIGCIAIGTVFLIGGETTFLGVKLKSEGLSNKILEWAKFLKENKEDKQNKIIKESAEALKLTTPYIEEIKNIGDDNLQPKGEN